MNSLTLNQIAERTGVSLRIIRYVLDQGMLPGTPEVTKADDRGRARTVMESEAFVIAIASVMLDAGIRRGVVKKALVSLVEMKGTLRRGLPPRPLQTVQYSKGPAQAVINSHGAVMSITLGDDVIEPPISMTHTVRFFVDLGFVRDALFQKPRTPLDNSAKKRQNANQE